MTALKNKTILEMTEEELLYTEKGKIDWKQSMTNELAKDGIKRPKLLLEKDQIRKSFETALTLGYSVTNACGLAGISYVAYQGFVNRYPAYPLHVKQLQKEVNMRARHYLVQTMEGTSEFALPSGNTAPEREGAINRRFKAVLTIFKAEKDEELAEMPNTNINANINIDQATAERIAKDLAYLKSINKA